MIHWADLRPISGLIDRPGLHWAFRLIPDSNKAFVSMNRPLPAHCISIKIARTDVVHIPYTQGKTSEPLIHVDSIFLKNFLSDDANFAHVCLCLFIKILYGLKPFLNLWLARRTSPCKFCVNTFIDRQLKTIQSIKHEGKLSSSSFFNKRWSIPHMPLGTSIALIISFQKGSWAQPNDAWKSR